VVREEDSRPRGLNPAVYWMDVRVASYYISIVKRKRIKVPKWGTPKKKYIIFLIFKG
jgi:hypothetical protein